MIETRPHRFDLTDVTAITVARTKTIQYAVIDAHGRVSRRSVYNQQERVALHADAITDRCTNKPLSTRSLYYLRFELADGTKTRELSLLDMDLPKFWSHQLVPVMGIDETVAYPYGPGVLVHTKLDELRDGTIRGVRVSYYVPMELVKVAMNRARVAPLPATGHLSHTRFTVKERHRAFWTPTARIQWTPEALAVFERTMARRWGERGTLADCINDRLAHAAGYSRNVNDAYTLHLACDSWSAQSFYWRITRDRDGNQMFNGGIIWHAGETLEDGEYAVHT